MHAISCNLRSALMKNVPDLTGFGNKQISDMVDSKITGWRMNNKEDAVEVGKNFNWHSICYVSGSCCRTLELEI